MNLIKKNEMDPELVRQLMEHSGYEVVKEASKGYDEDDVKTAKRQVRRDNEGEGWLHSDEDPTFKASLKGELAKGTEEGAYKRSTKNKKVTEEAEGVSIQNYLFEVNETFFSLTETVEEIEGELYLQLSEMAEDDVMNLDESTTAILESVIFDDVEYLLGESFVDEESGEVFVHLSIQEENDSE
jgi:hypothetical protein